MSTVQNLRKSKKYVKHAFRWLMVGWFAVSVAPGSAWVHLLFAQHGHPSQTCASPSQPTAMLDGDHEPNLRGYTCHCCALVQAGLNDGDPPFAPSVNLCNNPSPDWCPHVTCPICKVLSQSITIAPVWETLANGSCFRTDLLISLDVGQPPASYYLARAPPPQVS